ncbi:PAS domain-containing sensor histidine kinase [Mucilaginibacter phyllosphaerae]
MSANTTLEKENAELKHELRQLKISRHLERFHTIFESSRLPSKIIGPDLKIIEVNMALVELLGYSLKEDIVGTRIIDYSPVDQHEHWEILQANIWKKKTPFFKLETSLIRKDGSVIWCHITSILFPERQGFLGYSVIEDITDQRLLKLHKEEFISVASHELKTPITSLQANLQLMSRLLNGETLSKEKMIEMTRNAEKHVLKLSYLVNNLLSSTRLDQGHLSLDKTSFILAELIEDCCTHIRLEGKYHIDFTGDPAFTLFADRHKLDQVLVNLVNNAVKYAAGSFEIRIDASHSDGFTKVSVSDFGQGIAPENIVNLFDRYFRLGHDNNKNSGLGLGLYISAEIIRLHGGQIGVESELGKETTFWFTIPDRAETI